MEQCRNNRIRKKMVARKLKLGFLLLLGAIFAHAQNEIPKQLIVQLKAEANVEQLNTNALKFEKLSKSLPLYLLYFSDDEASNQAYQNLSQSNSVEFVQPNHQLERRETIPPDDLFNTQWYFYNNGTFGSYPAGVDIGAAAAWDSTTGGLTRLGDTIVVAVIDGYFNTHHPDLNFFINYDEVPDNGIDDDGNGFIDDYHGWNARLNNDSTYWESGNHATAISGIIGAKQNDTGIVGLNWGLKVLPVYADVVESQVIEAYDYVLEMRKLYMQSAGTKGAFVVAANSSFGIDNADPLDFPVWCSYYDTLGKYGIISVAATANTDVNVDTDGDMPTACASNFLITVNSTNGFDQKYSSGYGVNSIDLGAPGVGIKSTSNFNTYTNNTGTSFAAPMVAGTLALMFSQACEKLIQDYYAYPDSIALFMIQNILDGVDVLPSLSQTKSGGRLNAYNSLLLTSNYNCESCALHTGLIKTDVSCNGLNDGSIHLSFNDPNLLQSVFWSNGDTADNLNALAANSYFLVVTDTNNCQQSFWVGIHQPEAIVFDSVRVRHFEDANPGEIVAFVSGGGVPYQFSLNGSAFSSTSIFSGLGVGTYHIQVRDSSGCERDTTISIYHVGIDPQKNCSYSIVQTNENLFINTYCADKSQKIELLDVNGKRLASTYSHQIDISQLQKGIYLLCIYEPYGIYTKKILIH